MVIEVLEDVKVRVGEYIGDNVDGAGYCCGGLLLGVDGMEGEEGVQLVFSDEALAMASVDYEPEVRFVSIEVQIRFLVQRTLALPRAKSELNLQRITWFFVIRME